MKPLFTLILFLVFTGTVLAQCPTAGQDTSDTYCKNQVFDIADLRSDDAALSGVFIDPWGDTMTVTSISLIFPGQYTYRYIVSESGCPVDSAKYIVIIVNCWGGLSETMHENNKLIQFNPVNEQLILNEANYDQLEIYSTAGVCVLKLPPSLNTFIDVSKLEGGNYILVLDKNGSRQFQRFVKY
jgi:hypothetical protein